MPTRPNVFCAIWRAGWNWRPPKVLNSIHEGPDEILTVIRLGLPLELRRSLASTNIIESMNAVIRQVCRNVQRWRDAKMALRWTAAGMLEAAKKLIRCVVDIGFRFKREELARVV